MNEQASFSELLAKVRAGDQTAASELILRYEPAIRRFVRARLTDERLRRTLDTMDVCQSVLGGFFVRASLGEFELGSPDQLVKLLATMAANKLNEAARRQFAAKRGGGRQVDTPADELSLGGNSPTPSRIVSGRELLAEFRSLLSNDERYLLEQRLAGRSWAELAGELGVTADALRMRWTRLIDRAAVELEWTIPGL